MPVSSSCHYPSPWLLACPSLAVTTAFYGQRMTLLPFSSSHVPSMAAPTAPISHRLWLGAGSVTVTLTQWSQPFRHHQFHRRHFFHGPMGGWFWGDSGALHLLCTLLLLYQLLLRSSDIGSWRLGTHALTYCHCAVVILQWQFQVPTSSLKPFYTTFLWIMSRLKPLFSDSITGVVTQLFLGLPEIRDFACPYFFKLLYWSGYTVAVSGFTLLFRQAYWSGLPHPPPGDLSYPGIEPMSPALTDSWPLSHLGGAASKVQELKFPNSGCCPWVGGRLHKLWSPGSHFGSTCLSPPALW